MRRGSYTYSEVLPERYAYGKEEVPHQRNWTCASSNAAVRLLKKRRSARRWYLPVPSRRQRNLAPGAPFPQAAERASQRALLPPISRIDAGLCFDKQTNENLFRTVGTGPRLGF